MSSSTPPEYLEERATPRRRPRRVGTWLAVGGAVAAVGLVGGAAWAAWWWFDSGPQPAEALPAATLGYLAVDLDPNGAQKVEALRTLQKFPVLRDELDLDADDDLRRRIFEEIQAGTGCDRLDYGDDVEPWLGDRMAMAAVEGTDGPVPVFVLQLRDPEAAEAGVAALGECGGEQLGFVVDGEWGVLAETDEIAQAIVDDTADGSLADDAQFQRWTGEAGDAGVASAYVAAEAGPYLADLLGEVADPLGMGGVPADGYFGTTDDLDELGPDGEALDPQLLEGAFGDFEGMAAAVRFEDGALELEVAGGVGAAQTMVSGDDAAGDLVGGLPADTAAAVGLTFTDGWFAQAMEQAAEASGVPVEQLLADLSAMTGMELPEDAEALAGDAVALAVGGDFDPEAFLLSPDGAGLPIGLKIDGDPDEIEPVLDRLRGLGAPGALLDSQSSGEHVAVGPDDGYLTRLLDHGGLADTDAYRDVVREDAASSLLFVDFDAGEWLAVLAGDDHAVRENLAPLSGLGLSGWLEGEGDDAVAHGVLRITTN